MANISSSVTSYLFGLLTSDTGVNNALALEAAENGSEFQLEIRSVNSHNSSPDLVDRTSPSQYPALFLYCDKLTNTLREKFRTFSGKARMTVEIRCSQDNLRGLERTLEVCTDAVCLVLDSARGTWQDGAFYAGGYEVVYGAIKQGGRNFLQIAKVSFEVDISK